MRATQRWRHRRPGGARRPQTPGRGRTRRGVKAYERATLPTRVYAKR
ncbi:hypothetical protein BU14_0951s0004 [Porphyra umbilicalis]|uniref:Uncharacterized protein n=1 Tax=Porphyra umbilicalis TaxID=2786 RepID=A0A1X6NNE9_PORUM|nr:hypothetical protein BU14_0951s0004 [Porphyra umbilicalis]|eukprot:OSX70016.1 hypothetical protein BU14_0951s0004 [Porphyra umbilicalis]